MKTIDRLISHRFRGFSKFENTLEGFNAALSFGVQKLEFDIRVAKCGTPMIYHDEYALDRDGRKFAISGVMASDFMSRGGIFARIPTAEALFALAAKHSNQTSTLLIDIKDGGFEHEIHALIGLYRLQSRIVYVSWLPEVLYAIHALSPQTPLCLSHWCQPPDKKTRAVHKIYIAKDGVIPRPTSYNYVHGHRSGWFVDGPLKGELKNILIQTKGWVCVPQNMVSKSLVKNYQKHGIRVSTFSYTDWALLKSDNKKMGIDAYFIDNRTIFDALKTQSFEH